MRTMPLLIIGLLACVTVRAGGMSDLAVPSTKELDQLVSKGSDLAFELEPVPSDDPEALPQYLIRVENPSETTYDFLGYHLQGGFRIVEKGIVGEDGYLRPDPAAIPILFIPVGSFPAEPIFAYLVSQDGTAAAMQELIPHPKVVEKNGYKISLKVLDPKAEAFFLLVEGFEPGEPITVTSISCQEFAPPHHTRANEDGILPVLYSPAVVNEVGGTFTYRVSGGRGGVTLVSPWGTHYSQEYGEARQREIEYGAHQGGEQAEIGEGISAVIQGTGPDSRGGGRRLRTNDFLGGLLAPEAVLVGLFIPERMYAVPRYLMRPHRLHKAVAAYLCLIHPFEKQLKAADRWPVYPDPTRCTRSLNW